MKWSLNHYRYPGAQGGYCELLAVHSMVTQSREQTLPSEFHWSFSCCSWAHASPCDDRLAKVIVNLTYMLTRSTKVVGKSTRIVSVIFRLVVTMLIVDLH
jgi:hypothetical protein